VIQWSMDISVGIYLLIEANLLYPYGLANTG